LRVRLLLASLLLVAGLTAAGCGGGDTTDHNSAAIESAEESGRESQEVEDEVLSILRPKLHIRAYAGVDNAFQLPDGLRCSITGAQPASSYAYGIPDDDLVSPDGETVVQVNYFIDPEGTPEETIKAECLKATAEALGW
jgi:hypothetical protein